MKKEDTIFISPFFIVKQRMSTYCWACAPCSTARFKSRSERFAGGVPINSSATFCSIIARLYTFAFSCGARCNDRCANLSAFLSAAKDWSLMAFEYHARHRHCWTVMSGPEQRFAAVSYYGRLRVSMICRNMKLETAHTLNRPIKLVADEIAVTHIHINARVIHSLSDLPKNVQRLSSTL